VSPNTRQENWAPYACTTRHQGHADSQRERLQSPKGVLQRRVAGADHEESRRKHAQGMAGDVDNTLAPIILIQAQQHFPKP